MTKDIKENEFISEKDINIQFSQLESFEQLEEFINKEDFKRFLFKKMKSLKTHESELIQFIDKNENELIKKTQFKISDFKLSESLLTHSRPLSLEGKRLKPTDMEKRFKCYTGKIVICSPEELWDEYMIGGSRFLEKTVFNTGTGGGSGTVCSYRLTLWEEDFKNLKIGYCFSDKLVEKESDLFGDWITTEFSLSLDDEQLKKQKDMFLKAMKDKKFENFYTIRRFFKTHFLTEEKAYIKYLKESLKMFFNPKAISDLWLEKSIEKRESTVRYFFNDHVEKIKNQIINDCLNLNLSSKDKDKVCLIVLNISQAIKKYNLENHDYFVEFCKRKTEEGISNYFSNGKMAEQIINFYSNSLLYKNLNILEDEVFYFMNNGKINAKDLNNISKELVESCNIVNIRNKEIKEKLFDNYFNLITQEKEVESAALDKLIKVLDKEIIPVKNISSVMKIINVIENEKKSIKANPFMGAINNQDIERYNKLKEILISELVRHDLSNKFKDSKNGNKVKI